MFCDNNASLWHTSVEGIPVDSPKVAIEHHPDATFVVAIWHPSRTETMLDRVRHLKALGAKYVVPFYALFREYKELLPNLFWQVPEYYSVHTQEIKRAKAVLDPKGQAEFDRQMQLRMGDSSNQTLDPAPQYFPSDLIHLTQHEAFIDCGAYDGDTIEDFRRLTGDQFDRIVGFEPDPASFKALSSAVDGNPKISVRPYATDSESRTVRFDAGGTGAHISAAGTYAIQTITLDEALDGIKPTYIKFDIEGSEPDALEGGRTTILTHRPRLAVCVYHAPHHLWGIPLQLHELMPDSLLTLRSYCADGFDCVCYCIPR